ncbi:MAG TPA: GNAT family N-acetyltransferase [Pseudonocardiaceae bacterium]
MGDARDPGVTTRDNPELSRYEVYSGGSLGGFVAYRLNGDRMTLTHTETSPAQQGKGLATALIHDTLEAARDSGLSVLPACSFTSAYIRRHPEYLDLVPEADRARYGL